MSRGQSAVRAVFSPRPVRRSARGETSRIASAGARRGILHRHIGRSTALFRRCGLTCLAGGKLPAALLGFSTLRSLAPARGCRDVSIPSRPPAVRRLRPSRSFFHREIDRLVLQHHSADGRSRTIRLGYWVLSPQASRACPTHIGSGRCCLGLLLLQALRKRFCRAAPLRVARIRP